MKRLHKRFLLATFCALFTATLQAADVTITVNGRVVAKPCTIQTKEANVNLGDLYTRNLQQPGSASGWHNITLSLTDCPVETSAVTAIVTGSTDNTGYYKNEGTAENIQIELRDDQDAALKNGDSKTVIVDEITRNAQFPLKARAGFAPIFPDICYHLTHYKPAAADIPVASDNPAHYADAIRYNARTPLQGSLLPLTRLVWA